jgi:hypothetical protein
LWVVISHLRTGRDRAPTQRRRVPLEGDDTFRPEDTSPLYLRVADRMGIGQEVGRGSRLAAGYGRRLPAVYSDAAPSNVRREDADHGRPRGVTLPTPRQRTEESSGAMTTSLIDPIPIAGVFVLFMVITLACYEVGFRVGRWWQDRMPGEQEGPTEMLVGSLLALMAFVLAITMGMAADRFDTRRGLVVEDATAIATAYMRADYLPESEAQQVKTLVREYLPLRITTTSDRAEVQADVSRSLEIHAELWAIQAAVAATDNSDLIASFGDSLTDLVATHERRVVAGLYARVPETVIMLLLVGSALSLGMVGFAAGLKKRRSVLSAVVLVVALGIVTTLVIDLDRPQDGFLRVSQQALIDVGQWIGAPPP